MYSDLNGGAYSCVIMPCVVTDVINSMINMLSDCTTVHSEKKDTVISLYHINCSCMNIIQLYDSHSYSISVIIDQFFQLERIFLTSSVTRSL